MPLRELLGKLAVKAEVEPEALRHKGRAAKLVEARDRFICQAVMEQGYRASEVAAFLHCHPSNTSRALQKTSPS